MTQCINCGGSEFTNFFTEEIPCSHCDEITEVKYVMCNTCGMLSGALFTDADTQQLFQTNVADLIDLFNNVIGEGEPAGVAGPATTMSDMLHSCIRCNTKSYEKNKGLWHCPECGFEWEVIPGV